MNLNTSLYRRSYSFNSLKEVLAKANEERSGDQLAGLSALSAEERVAAKIVLSNVLMSDLRNSPAVPYEEDEVTRIIQDDVNERIYSEIKNKSVSEMREWILNGNTSSLDVKRASRGMTSEMVAAITKIMSNLDLIVGAKKIRIQATCNTTIGVEGTFSSRVQPNHTTDNIDGILASLYDGLSFGSGDALIGLNPVDDTVGSVVRILNTFEEVKQKWQIPTQHCVLAHVTTQMEAIRSGAPSDLCFQSIAGSEKGNEAFGFNASILKEAQDLLLREGTARGPNVMYLETGQGSELSSNAHFGTDQVTMEARCYGFARRFSPFIVNTVVGFIGPEYLYDSKQVIRAGLEDHFMGKLSGISMGVDVCYTNHMKADQNDIENLLVLLSTCGCNYVIGIPHGDDIMLNYQTTGYHDTATMRELLGLTPIKEFADWMDRIGITDNGKITKRFGDASIFLV